MKVGAPSCFQFFHTIKSLEGYNSLKTQATFCVTANGVTVRG